MKLYLSTTLPKPPDGKAERVWLRRLPSGGLTLFRRGKIPLIKTDYSSILGASEHWEVDDTPANRAAGAQEFETIFRNWTPRNFND